MFARLQEDRRAEQGAQNSEEEYSQPWLDGVGDDPHEYEEDAREYDDTVSEAPSAPKLPRRKKDQHPKEGHRGSREEPVDDVRTGEPLGEFAPRHRALKRCETQNVMEYAHADQQGSGGNHDSTRHSAHTQGITLRRLLLITFVEHTSRPTRLPREHRPARSISRQVSIGTKPL